MSRRTDCDLGQLSRPRNFTSGPSTANEVLISSSSTTSSVPSPLAADQHRQLWLSLASPLTCAVESPKRCARASGFAWTEVVARPSMMNVFAGTALPHWNASAGLYELGSHFTGAPVTEL